jgi:adenine/guanine phosphoribosyltransferase-like PRPP-binding protein
VLVLGGTALAMVGIARSAGVKPADVAAVTPVGRAAKTAKGA